MQFKLLRRIQRLEDIAPPIEIRLSRYGWRIDLPANYVGERHTVAQNRERIAPGIEWCDFVEQPGPAQVDE
jgi:hypothetical protein